MDKTSATQIREFVERMSLYTNYIDSVQPMEKSSGYGRALGLLAKGLGSAAVRGVTKSNLDWGATMSLKALGKYLPFARATRKSTVKDGVEYVTKKWQHDPNGKNLGDKLYNAGQWVEDMAHKYTGGTTSYGAARQLLRNGNRGAARTVLAARKAAPWVATFGAPGAAAGMMAGGWAYDAATGANKPGALYNAGQNLLDSPVDKYLNWGAMHLHPWMLAAKGIQGVGTAAWNGVTNYATDKAMDAKQRAIQAIMDNKGTLAAGLTFAPGTTRDFIDAEATKLIERSRIGYLVQGSDEWVKAVQKYIETYGESPIQQ